MENVPGLTAPPVGAPELTKWDSAGVASWLLAKEEAWATEMAETLQLAGTTGTELASLTLQDLLEAEELGIPEDHAQLLLAAVRAECSLGSTRDEPEPEPELELEGSQPDAEEVTQLHKPESQLLLRAELEGLKLGAINRRAMTEGVHDDIIEAAMDSADPKAALIDAFVHHAATK